jgi:predicted amidophosphoribosyltransferase
LNVTNESTPPAESYVVCEGCGEQNKRGSTRCARCGAELPVVVGAKVDPELRAFNIAQAQLAEGLRSEYRKGHPGFYWARRRSDR